MIMKETPVNKIMENTLEKMRQMVDTSTIIGEPMVTGTTTLIPVSKVSYGFTSGGTDLPSKQNQELFGGGGGGGITKVTHLNYILAFINSCVFHYLINAISPTLNFEVGQIGMQPIIFDDYQKNDVQSRVDDNIQISRQDWDSYETSWDFKKNPLI